MAEVESTVVELKAFPPVATAYHLRAVPVAEAMLAITFLDQLLEHESQIGSVI